MNYQKQAEQFLQSTNTEIEIKASLDETPPRWIDKQDAVYGRDYGQKFNITLKRGGDKWHFEFWNSIANYEIRKKPTAG